jgi:hypothetical protein
MNISTPIERKIHTTVSLFSAPEGIKLRELAKKNLANGVNTPNLLIGTVYSMHRELRLYSTQPW